MTLADVLAYCVDRYIASQIQAIDGPSVSSKTKDHEMLQQDDRLEAVVERMFERCIEDKEYKQVRPFPRKFQTNVQALGVAIESRRIDTITRILQLSKDASLLDYVLDVAMNHVRHIQWRNRVIPLCNKSNHRSLGS